MTTSNGKDLTHEAKNDTSDSISPSQCSTKFFGSQIGGQTVINYSYTDPPIRLLGYDIFYFFHYAWALPYIVWPFSPSDSGKLDELSLTFGNVFCLGVHLVLFVLQVGLILCLPLTLILPFAITIPLFSAFLIVSKVLCRLLNGKGVIYHSNPKYAAETEDNAHEQWIFCNGVAVGEHWLQNNLDRLALTFKRPIVGIHNRTSGIIFDVFECLIQRNFSYATGDVRVLYRILKDKLYNPQYTKVVLILHSQGGIEGGLALDWLLQELPQNLLAKLEVYTFGNAANHFNNPHRHLDSQTKAMGKPEAAAVDATHASDGHKTGTTNKDAKTNGNGKPSTIASNGTGPQPTSHIRTDVKPDSLLTSSPTQALSSSSRAASSTHDTTQASTTETEAADPASVSDRAIGHIEHYAHTTDFVSLWGILHFATSATATHTMPRFIGRLFSRTSARGGHQFCQHYLDGMFPLETDSATGQFTGCKEVGNEFMESEVVMGQVGDDGIDTREAFEQSYLGCLEDELEDEFQGGIRNGLRRRRTRGGGKLFGSVPVTLHNEGSPTASRVQTGIAPSITKIKVKELSRLWKYRNGKSPSENASMLQKGPDGFIRESTM